MATAWRYLIVDECGEVTGTDDERIAEWYEDYVVCNIIDTLSYPVKEADEPVADEDDEDNYPNRKPDDLK